jgi:hypothetical protein
MSSQSEKPDPQALLVVGQVGAGVMALALVLPWLGHVFESHSYLSLCVKTCVGVIDKLGKMPKGTPAPTAEELLTLVGFFVSLFAPAAAVLIAVATALRSLGGKMERKAAFDGFIGAGVVGLLGLGGFLYFCTRAPSFSVDGLFSGFYLFAVASLIVLVTAGMGSAGERE